LETGMANKKRVDGGKDDKSEKMERKAYEK
jgi:hypothetical protein